MNKTSLLVASDLCKSFIEGELSVDVLRGVDLTIQEKDSIAIIGASGSGKSTLLHLLGGLDLPSQGEIRINGKCMSDLNDDERGQIRNQYMGFVYQFHHLLPEFTALENVAMPLLIRRMNRAEGLDKASEMLEKVGMSERKRHKPGEMSGGERQRTAIARALVTRPRCMFVDEPTGNLDEHTAGQVFDLMLELNSDYDTTLIMVTHNMNLAKRMHRILELREGRLHVYDSRQ
ncbi:MAG: lipoprotein-releasing ABC transporter ATP-binding protein LolD [Gammaproteobacteria bacterium]